MNPGDTRREPPVSEALLAPLRMQTEASTLTGRPQTVSGVHPRFVPLQKNETPIEMSVAAFNFDSTFQRRATLCGYVEAGRTDEAVLRDLIVDGTGISDEAVLWDFKKELPVLPGEKLNDRLKQEYDAKFAEIVKDCVALYNAYGGYLIAGVEDSTRKLVGFARAFDAAGLNTRIQSATGVNIETVFRTLQVEVSGQQVPLGLLFVPKRPERVLPAQFKKDAPESATGKKAYRQHEFFLRERDTCRRAVSPEDLEFLYGPRRLDEIPNARRLLDHNLPSRDPELELLIGRESEIAELWMWLADAFSPVKILSGVGGVGKTSIAFTFAERLVYAASSYFDRVLWLSAKSETFSPTIGRDVPTTRHDFGTIDALLVGILLESGCPTEQIPDDPSRDALLTLCQQHLSAYSYVLFIDNVDSLDDEEQQTIFHLFTQIGSTSKSKIVLTARRNLGASRSVYMEIEGFSFGDFQEFVQAKCQTLRIKKPPDLNAPIMKEFYEVSGGSPLFALSILRLVMLGDSLKGAISNWRGSDGEAVRAAAFEREVGRLNSNEAKTLLVLSYLQSASAVEIASIVKLTRHEVQNALETLQAFSMTTIDASLPGGATFSIPTTLALVSSLVEQRVREWRELKAECERVEAVSADKPQFVGQAVSRTIALMKTGDREGARLTVEHALQTLPTDPDLHCLMGRYYAEALGDLGRAEEHYIRAHELGCKKRALFDGWLSVLERRADWTAVIEVSALAESSSGGCRYRIIQNQARMARGDQFSRTGNYQIADSQYEEALKDLRLAYSAYTYPADRAEIRRLSEAFVIRWLGVVRMLATSSPDGSRRFFGACHKAVLTYHSRNTHVLHSALASLREWLARIGGRRNISDTVREQLLLANARVEQLRSHVETRPGYTDEFKHSFGENSVSTRAAIERLLQ